MFLIHSYPGLFLRWHYFEMPKKMLKVTGNFLRFGVSFYSVPLMMKTFFSPWRGYYKSYGRGFHFKKFFHALGANCISRTLGAIVRFFLLIFFVITEIFFAVTGIALLILWVFLPLLTAFVFYQGFVYIF